MGIRIIEGDCRNVLKTLPDQSVQCVVTSPPYFGLRSYGVGAENGEIGSEPNPTEFIAVMVSVFREVWRVLRNDGTLWLNLGDSYATGTSGPRKPTYATGPAVPASWSARSQPERIGTPDGMKTKDLLMIPARVAIALQDDGWYLRSDIIWAKKNCMPESVTDRPSNAHEHIFLLTKSPRYFYDAEAIREEGVIPAGTRAAKGSNVRSELKDVNGRPPEYWEYTGMRNARNVWSMATKPFSGAHFATFPPELPERCILAGTSERGACPTCGAPWSRSVEKSRTFESGSGRAGTLPTGKNDAALQGGGETKDIRRGPVVHTMTTGWQPTCSCPTVEPVPCVVLDPFGGAGTVGLVADRLRRDAILIELNPEYASIGRLRVFKDAGLFAAVTP